MKTLSFIALSFLINSFSYSYTVDAEKEKSIRKALKSQVEKKSFNCAETFVGEGLSAAAENQEELSTMMKKFVKRSINGNQYKLAINDTDSQPIITLTVKESSGKYTLSLTTTSDLKELIAIDYDEVKTEYQTSEREINIGTVIDPVFVPETPVTNPKRQINCNLL